MKTEVTQQGVLIPRDYFPGVKTVEIRKAKEGVVVVPVLEEDPILQMGRHPVDDDITDASVNHDRYLLGP
jgi:hypothetical protein